MRTMSFRQFVAFTSSFATPNERAFIRALLPTTAAPATLADARRIAAATKDKRAVLGATELWQRFERAGGGRPAARAA